jgi:hypothetical protein
MTPTELVLSKVPDAKPAGPGKFQAHCPDHKDRKPSLSIAQGDDGRALVFCHAGCKPQAIVAALGLTLADLMPPKGNGYHKLRDDQDWHAQRTRTIRVSVIHAPLKTTIDFPALARQYRAAVNADALAGLGRELGVSVDSLNRLGVGWSREVGTWSFPMANSSGHVRGIRLRRPSGRKFAVTGGKEGLFNPDGLAGDVLLIAEGATDTAALLDLEFSAVGRPSCTGGTALLVELVRARKPRQVVIVADADAPGQRGAAALASVLVLYVPDVRIITPPAPHKDARAWKIGGATHADIQVAIGAAPVRKLTVEIKKVHQ